jgi:hypothetical protein
MNTILSNAVCVPVPLVVVSGRARGRVLPQAETRVALLGTHPVFAITTRFHAAIAAVLSADEWEHAIF